MAKILITGSTGFIGKQLSSYLCKEGHEIYALTRHKESTQSSDLHMHYLNGDIKDPKNVEPFPKDVDAAYYLVHSMGANVTNLIEYEKEIAENFIELIEKTECKQIIYLAGIIEDEKTLSPHLHSRLAVEKILKSSKIPCTILRSSIIIGPKSASFCIISDLVEKLPIMLTSRWVRNLTQPISISDVLFYLKGVLLNSRFYRKTCDIGGPEKISFKDLLLRYAKVRGLKRWIFTLPLLTPRLSSYWLVLITSVKFSICRYLVESMRQNSTKATDEIDTLLPHSCYTYEEALEQALKKS